MTGRDRSTFVPILEVVGDGPQRGNLIEEIDGGKEMSIRPAVRWPDGRIDVRDQDPDSVPDSSDRDLDGYDRGREDEKDTIVGWLLAGAPGAEKAYESCDVVPNIIEAIERGEHRK